MMKSCQKINLQEPQRNRNATAFFVNLIMTGTVYSNIAYPDQRERERERERERHILFVCVGSNFAFGHILHDAAFFLKECVYIA